MHPASSVAPVWDALAARDREMLGGKLSGLYDCGEADGVVFDSLATDKRRALLLIASRYDELDIWRHVRRVTNIYGTGGTGVEFFADNHFTARLDAHPDFTTRFARHRDSSAGYFERRRRRGALHLLRANAEGDSWSAHFDLHSPVASPLSFARHVWHERIRGVCPGWRDFDRGEDVNDPARNPADGSVTRGRLWW